MRKSESESPLERRLRELEEEERALQQNLKEVTRKARKMESLTGEPGLTRTEPRLASTVPRPGAPEPDELPDEEPELELPPARPSPAPGMAPRNPAPRSSDQFASYFASGSFGKARPLGRERRVMRNKAIFMLILVALVAFVVYRLVFGS